MKNGNTPAAPLALDIRVNEQGDQFCNDAWEGLTKREHFAGLAMQGLLSRGFGGGGLDGWEQRLSCKAVTIADALLKELDK